MVVALTMMSQMVMFLMDAISFSPKRDCEIMSHLSLYLIWPDGGCIDDDVTDGDVPNGRNLVLTIERL
jgi:hypothetical protein